MKSIETKWKGYRFRSRTEARWAVFLENAGIPFEYEPEGILLPTGPYLPDFRLSNFNLPRGAEPQDVWLEIKGAEPTDEERLKCARLAAESGCPVLLAVGAPDFAQQVYLFGEDALSHKPEGMDGAQWIALLALIIGPLAFMNVGGPGDDTIVVARGPRDSAEHENDDIRDAADGSDEEWAAFNEVSAIFDGIFCRVLGMQDGRLPQGKACIGLGQKLKDAYDAARSARFEFGQTDKRWT